MVVVGGGGLTMVGNLIAVWVANMDIIYDCDFVRVRSIYATVAHRLQGLPVAAVMSADGSGWSEA